MRKYIFKDRSGPPESTVDSQEGSPSAESPVIAVKDEEQEPYAPDPTEEHEILSPHPFPISALNPIQRRIAEEVARVHQIDVALPAMAALAVFAGALGKSHVVRAAASGRDTHTNIYILAGAPKGYGKGATASIAAPLVSVSDEIARSFTSTMRPALLAQKLILEERIKGLVRKLGKADGDEFAGKDGSTNVLEQDLVKAQENLELVSSQLRCPPSLWIGSTTSAALSEFLGRNDETIFYYSPEAGDLVRISLGKFSKDNAADFDLLLSGYTVEPFRETRIGRGDKQMTPCITVLWFCQPFLLRELIGSKEALERGLTARMLMFVVEHDEIPEDDGVYREITPDATKDWDALVRRAIQSRDNPVIVHCSPEAHQILTDYHNETVRYRNNEFRDIQGELARSRESAIRLAGAQCLADHLMSGGSLAGELVLTAEQAVRGIRIAKWAQSSGLRLMQASRLEQKKKRVSRLIEILLEHDRSMTLRDLENRHGFPLSEAQALAREFPHQFLIATGKPTRGRPSMVIKLVMNVV